MQPILPLEDLPFWKRCVKMVLALFPKTGMTADYVSLSGKTVIAEAAVNDVNPALGAPLGYNVRLEIAEGGDPSIMVYATQSIPDRRPLSLYVRTPNGNYSDESVPDAVLKLIGGACLSAPCREPASEVAAA